MLRKADVDIGKMKFHIIFTFCSFVVGNYRLRIYNQYHKIRPPFQKIRPTYRKIRSQLGQDRPELDQIQPEMKQDSPGLPLFCSAANCAKCEHSLTNGRTSKKWIELLTMPNCCHRLRRRFTNLFY